MNSVWSVPMYVILVNSPFNYRYLITLCDCQIRLLSVCTPSYIMCLLCAGRMFNLPGSLTVLFPVISVQDRVVWVQLPPLLLCTWSMLRDMKPLKPRNNNLFSWSSQVPLVLSWPPSLGTHIHYLHQRFILCLNQAVMCKSHLHPFFL